MPLGLVFASLLVVPVAAAAPWTTTGPESTADLQLTTPTPASDPDAERAAFEAIAEAYRDREGKRYLALVQHENRLIRRSLPPRCVAAQTTLLEVGCGMGFDGLESVYLGLQDCASAAEAPPVRAAALANAETFASCLHYEAEPAAQLSEPFSRWDSPVSRPVRAEALRAVIDEFVAWDPAEIVDVQLDDLLSLSGLHEELCDLPLRLNEAGEVALTELIRAASCTLTGSPGGPGAIDAICRDLQGGDGVPTLASSAPQNNMAPLSGGDLSRLDELCSGLTGAGGAEPGMGPMDPFASDSCIEPEAKQRLENTELSQVMSDCSEASMQADGSPVAGLSNGGSSGNDEPPPTTDVQDPQTSVEEEKSVPGRIKNFFLGVVGALSSGYSDLTNGLRKRSTFDAAFGLTRQGNKGAGHFNENASRQLDQLDNKGGGAEQTTVDLSEPACQELVALSVGNGHDTFDELFEREEGRDPRTEYPNPDETSEPPSDECIGSGNHAAGSICDDLILCEGDLTMSPDTCSCTSPSEGGSPGRDCSMKRCAEGETAEPVGDFGCSCTGGEADFEPNLDDPFDPLDPGGDGFPGGGGPGF
ncbi:MAG: hypothetical protein AAGA54_05430 [Myxococcota bacterium]